MEMFLIQYSSKLKYEDIAVTNVISELKIKQIITWEFISMMVFSPRTIVLLIDSNRMMTFNDLTISRYFLSCVLKYL